MNFDIIGDIHGEADALKRLLNKLGYDSADGVFKHPTRTVIFLGDFIDRGPAQREVIRIVRAMCEAGSAQAVMGNHEFNAIAYSTPNGTSHLRPHSDKNRKQHLAFLKAYEGDKNEYKAVIAWFKTLPLWLELDGLRIIHACWDRGAVDRILKEYKGPMLSDELLWNAAKPGCWEYDDIETILKGKEMPLPEASFFHDKDGVPRHAIRVKWWDSEPSYRSAYIGPPEALTHIPDDPMLGDHMIEYGHDEIPVFIGHYWLSGEPEPLAPNIACVDYSVAKSGGKLVAYRFDGESRLSTEKFVSVNRGVED